jgi:hypothetical protein
MNAPMAEPRETLAEIRRIADVVLPGYRLQRRFFFRYILVWQKPVPQAGLASESPIA